MTDTPDFSLFTPNRLRAVACAAGHPSAYLIAGCIFVAAALLSANVGAATPVTTGSTAAAAEKGPKEAVLTVSSWAPAGHLLTATLRQWCDALATRRPGHLRCNRLDNPIAPIAETLDAVRRDAVDIAIVAHGIDPAQHVVSRIAELPMSSVSAEAGSVALQQTWTESLAQVDEYPGVRVLAMFVQLPAQLYTVDQAVQSLDDLTGMAVRGGGGIGSQIVATLAARRVTDRTLPLAAVANEVRDHVIDGALVSSDNMQRYELTKSMRHGWVIPGGFHRQSFALVINDVVWQRLNATQKSILDELGGERAARLFGRAADLLDASLMGSVEAAGVEVWLADSQAIQALGAQLAPVSLEWVRDAEARGLAHARRVLGEFRRRVAGEQGKIGR